MLLLAREAGGGNGERGWDASGGSGFWAGGAAAGKTPRELEGLGPQLLQKAEAADEIDRDGEGTQLPAELCDRQQRRPNCWRLKR